MVEQLESWKKWGTHHQTNILVSHEFRHFSGDPCMYIHNHTHAFIICFLGFCGFTVYGFMWVCMDSYGATPRMGIFLVSQIQLLLMPEALGWPSVRPTAYCALGWHYPQATGVVASRIRISSAHGFVLSLHSPCIFHRSRVQFLDIA